jgi:regulator of replication initiation timing
MSEAPVAPEGGNTPNGETPAADEFKPIATRAEMDAFLRDRVARVEKKASEKYADYDDLKAKAAKLDEIEQANQTEAEKAAKRLAELEAELTTTRRDALRIKIASTHGITDADDIDLFLTGTDEETLTKQAKRLAERTADRKKAHVVPGEGKTTTVTSGDADRRAFVRQLTGRE